MATSRSTRVALSGGLLTWVVLAAVSAVVYAVGSNGLDKTTTLFLVNVCLVCSLQVFVGNSGLLSFGHVAFMGIGAYVTAVVTIPLVLRAQQVPNLPSSVAELRLGLLPAVLLSAVLCAVFGLLVGLVFVAMRVEAMVMATLALLVVVYAVLVNWTEITRGSQGLFGIPLLVGPPAAIIAAGVFIVLSRWYKGSAMGLRLRATREDPISAASVGIDVPRARLGAWVLSAVMMGAGGSLWALTVIAMGPEQFFFEATFSLLAMLVVGGREGVAGAVVGVALVTIVTETLSQVERGVVVAGVAIPQLTGVVQFAVAGMILVMLIWRPQGILGGNEIEDLLPSRWRRSLAAGGLAAGARPVPAPAVVPSRPEPGPGVPRLRATAIRKRFGELKALDGVDLEVAPGEILGLIGPNGSGKSTLLNVLSGVTRPDTGSVELLGRDATRLGPNRIARSGLSRTFQNIRLFDNLTVRENVRAGARGEQARDDRVDALLVRLGLADVLDAPADSLAYGLQRRLEIARALVSEPAVLLLDEPAAGMNEQETDTLLHDIRAVRDDSGCSIVVVDHDLRLIMHLCDRIQVLEQGRTLAVGTPDAVVADPAVVAAYLGRAEIGA
jgi:branched-chain amino acid transport system permease protein